MDRNFGGAIWTDHAISRMRERGIKQGDAWATWNNPDEKRSAAIRGAYVYYKTYGNEKIEVVSKKNERGEWVILSVWSRPVYGTIRSYTAGSKAWNNLLERTLNFLLGWARKK